MRIRDEIAAKHWLNAAKEETVKQLREKGFRVVLQKQLGNFRADLVARKGSQVFVYEFKSPGWPREQKQASKSLRNYVVHELQGRFNLVWVAPPRERSIVIEGLEDVLRDLMTDDFPSDLDELSTHTIVEGVTDVFVETGRIAKDEVEIKGSGLVEVGLHYGSDSDRQRDDGTSHEESFPFAFHVILDGTLAVVSVRRIEVDTSSFYE